METGNTTFRCLSDGHHYKAHQSMLFCKLCGDTKALYNSTSKQGLSEEMDRLLSRCNELKDGCTLQTSPLNFPHLYQHDTSIKESLEKRGFTLLFIFGEYKICHSKDNELYQEYIRAMNPDYTNDGEEMERLLKCCQLLQGNTFFRVLRKEFPGFYKRNKLFQIFLDKEGFDIYEKIYMTGYDICRSGSNPDVLG